MQCEFEQYCAELGTNKIINSVNEASDFEAEYTKKIVENIIEPFSKYITNEVEITIAGYSRGKIPILMALFDREASVNWKCKSKLITSLQVSFIVAKAIIGTLRVKEGEAKRTQLAATIGRIINYNLTPECRFDGKEDEVRIGGIMLELFVRRFPQYVKKSMEFQDKKAKWKENHFIPTQEYLDVIDSNISDIAGMTNIKFPMVEIPKKWGSAGNDGGYYTEHFRHSLVKREKNTTNLNLPENVYSYVNLIQETPWTINLEIYATLKRLEKTKPSTLKKVYPLSVPKPEPRPFPKSLKYADMNDDERKIHQTWATTTERLAADKQAKKSVDLSRHAAVNQAEFFIHSDFYNDKLFFPHDNDYRMRVYNMAMTGLNTQGADFQKALIKFANPRQVKTELGIRWMKINMANLMGFDKERLDERVRICNEMEAIILEVVADPIRCTHWHQWDKPLQGLAAAMEYAKWLKNDQAFINTHVQLDGLCNGVQNLAALTRDHDVAPHVGLVYTEERGDVYNYVLDEVKRRVSSSTENVAREWEKSGLLIRNLAKKPVMTRAYAATLHGIKDGCKEFIATENKMDMFTDHWHAGNWIGDTIWDSMNIALEGPMKFMDWSTECAKRLANAGLPIIWTNPSGKKCSFSPFETKRQRINAKFNGSVQTYYIQTFTNKISKSEAMSGVSPNLIHGCDGSHLEGTTNTAGSRGVTDFAMVHDSIGTHPDDTQALLDSAKDSWVKQYSYDWITHWYEEWTQQGLRQGIHLDLPNPTDIITFGNLDINAVKESDFFFA